MKKLVVFLVLLLVISTVLTPWMAIAQGPGQADLLERAYSTGSYELLSRFFDNWHKEVTSNEAEAADPWLKEAYKVYAAVCQPEMMERWYVRVSLTERPFLIVQGKIWEVGYLQQSDRFFRGSKISSDLSFTVVDSVVAFRPNLLIDGVTTVYLTEGYEELVNDYFATPLPMKLDLLDITDEDIDEEDSQPIEFTVEDEERLDRGQFLRKHVNYITACYFSGWRIRPFLTIDKIIFSPSRKYAVVEYTNHGDARGGSFLMKKKHDKWVFVRILDIVVWSHAC